MVQIAMLIAGFVAGRKAADGRQAAALVGLVFAVTLAVQTVLVGSDDGFATAGDVVIYVVVQLVSLAVGIGVARLVLARRTRTTA